MSKYLRTNDPKDKKQNILAESQFAQQVLAHVGGSCVYIEPKKAKKFVDLTEIK